MKRSAVILLVGILFCVAIGKEEEEDNVDLIRFLVERGASRSAKDNNGHTPLHLAAAIGRIAAVRALVPRGELEDRPELLAVVRDKDDAGRTALHLAAGAGHAHVLEELLELHSDLEATDGAKAKALHHAAEGGHERAIRVLLAWGAEVNPKDGEMATPLHRAGAAGDEGAVRALLEGDADRYALDRADNTPYDYCRAEGHAFCDSLLAVAVNRGHTEL